MPPTHSAFVRLKVFFPAHIGDPTAVHRLQERGWNATLWKEKHSSLRRGGVSPLSAGGHRLPQDEPDSSPVAFPGPAAEVIQPGVGR